MIVTKILLSVVIKDKPQWISDAERDQELQMEDLFNLLDQKEKDYRDHGGVPINDVIQQIRAEKMSQMYTSQNTSKVAREDFKDEIEDDLDVQ